MATCDYNANSAYRSYLTSLHKFAACNDKPAALTQFGLPARAPATPTNLIINHL